MLTPISFSPALNALGQIEKNHFIAELESSSSEVTSQEISHIVSLFLEKLREDQRDNNSHSTTGPFQIKPLLKKGGVVLEKSGFDSEGERDRIGKINRHTLLLKKIENIHDKTAFSATAEYLFLQTKKHEGLPKTEVLRPLFDFFQEFKNFLLQKEREIPLAFSIIQLRIELDDLITDVPSTRLAANIFDDDLFKNKQFKLKSEEIVNIEGQKSINAGLIFAKGLADFYNEVRNEISNEESIKFKQIFEGYHAYLLSCFMNQESTAANILEQDILSVQSKKKGRGYWEPNIEKHTTILRYEVRNDKFLIGLFNLGGGVNKINEHSNGKATSETRITKRAYEPSLKDFCTRITKRKSLEEFIPFLNVTAHYLKRTSHIAKEPSAPYHPEQNLQHIGSCTCRSQWALLRSEFFRLFGPHPLLNYRRFKRFFHQQILSNMRQSIPHSMITLGEDFSKTISLEKVLTDNQVFVICWRNHNRWNFKLTQKVDHFRAEDRWKAIKVKFRTSDESFNFTPTYCTLEDLFGSNEQVVIGKLPRLHEEETELIPTSYYRIPNFYPLKSSENPYQFIHFISLVLKKSDQGGIVIVPKQALSVEENEIIKRYEKDEEFNLKIGMTIQFHHFVIDFSNWQSAKKVNSDTHAEKNIEELKRDSVLQSVKKSGALLQFAANKYKNDKEIVIAAIKQDAKAIQFASEELKKELDVLLTLFSINRNLIGQEGWMILIGKDHFYFKHASEKLKNIKEVVLAAVRQNPCSVEFASDRLKDDEEIVLTAIKNDPSSFEYAGNRLKNMKEFVLKAVKKNGSLLQYVEDKFKKDKEIVLAAIKQDAKAIQFASEELKKELDVLLTLFSINRNLIGQEGWMILIGKDHFYFKHAPEQLKNNRDVVLAAVKKDPHSMKFASYSFKDDEEIVLTAIENDPSSFEYAGNRLKNTKEFVLYAVEKKAALLQFIEDKYKNDKEIVIAAIKQDANAIQFASEEVKKELDVLLTLYHKNRDLIGLEGWLILIKKDHFYFKYSSKEIKNSKEMVLLLIKRAGQEIVFQYASEKLKDDKEVVLAAVRQSPFSVEFASQRMRDCREVILNAVLKNGLSLKFASSRLKDDPEIVLSAILNNPHSFQYASKRLKNSKHVVWNAVSRKGSLLKKASPALQDDRDLVLAAMDNDPASFEFASRELRNNLTFVYSAFKLVISKKKGSKDFRFNPHLLEFVSVRLRNHRELVFFAVKHDPGSFKFASKRFKIDKDIALMAVKNNGLLLSEVGWILQNDYQLVLAAIKNDPSSIKFAVRLKEIPQFERAVNKKVIN